MAAKYQYGETNPISAPVATATGVAIGDILGYDTEYIYLQLYIKNPWEVSADGQFDTITVTFWGTEYFKSISNKEVRYGTKLTHKLFR